MVKSCKISMLLICHTTDNLSSCSTLDQSEIEGTSLPLTVRPLFHEDVCSRDMALQESIDAKIVSVSIDDY